MIYGWGGGHKMPIFGCVNISIIQQRLNKEEIKNIKDCL